jgi:DNA mismatch repair protein MSH6
MGGKSTLLRQTCLAVILAQIGCFVPAERCLLTPVDRIFTRIGAFDNILEGKSTFFVEMEETKAILEKATSNSLVILDELGRGTSTFDGQALADSVLNHLVNKIGCRGLFSTHYHTLSEKYSASEDVEICRMAYNFDQEKNQLIYLYQLQKGACPSSFGINVAKIAGLPQSVLDKST